MPPLQGMLIILISGLPLVWALRMRKKSVTIIVVSSMFFLTYALRLVLIHVDPYSWTSPGAWITSGAVGHFDFSANSFWELTAIVFTGTVTFGLGCATAYRLLPNESKVVFHDTSPGLKPTIKFLVFFFPLGVAAFLLIMRFFGIGITGHVSEQNLPFKIAGFLYYGRWYLLPVLGAAIIQVLITNRKWRALGLFYGGMFLVSVLSGLLFLSRVGSLMIIGPLLPILIYSLQFESAKKHTLKLLRVIIFITILGFVITVNFVEKARLIAYTYRDFSTGSAIIEPLKLFKLTDSIDLARVFHWGSGSRPGINDLMAFMAAGPVKSPMDQLVSNFAPFFADNERSYSSIISMSHGADVREKGGYRPGISSSLLGHCYYSHSFIVFSILCLFYGLISVGFERYLLSKGLWAPALAISCVLGIRLAEGPSDNLYHIIIILAAGYWLCSFIIRSRVHIVWK